MLKVRARHQRAFVSTKVDVWLIRYRGAKSKSSIAMACKRPLVSATKLFAGTSIGPYRRCRKPDFRSAWLRVAHKKEPRSEGRDRGYGVPLRDRAGCRHD